MLSYCVFGAGHGAIEFTHGAYPAWPIHLASSRFVLTPGGSLSFVIHFATNDYGKSSNEVAQFCITGRESQGGVRLKARILGIAVSLLAVTNLVTGWLLYSAIQDRKELDRRDAGMAIGQLHEAWWDLQPVTGASNADAPERVLRAAQKLQISYQALYGLELRNELPTNGQRWSAVTNVIQGPLNRMIISRDYSDLPTVKRRLEGIADLVPVDSQALPKLRETQNRLREVFR